MALAGVFELGQEEVPLGADCAGTTAALSALGVNDGLDFVNN